MRNQLLFFTACEWGRTKLAMDLCHRIDPSARDLYGRTGLMLAALKGHAHLVRLLLGLCDPSARDSKGCTALMLAIHGGDPDTADALIPASDAKATDDGGATCLMHAVFYGRAALAEKLIPASDLSAQGIDGRDALLLASGGLYPRIIQLLLEGFRAQSTAPPCACNLLGDNALMLAACKGRIENAKLLLPYFDPSQTNAKGETASDIAKARGHFILADLLDHAWALRIKDEISIDCPAPAAKPRAPAL